MAFGDATRAQIEVWCDNVDAPSAEADRLFSELERAGVRCYPVQPGGSSPGVVLFDAVSDELRARLYERSRASRERTIAVSVRRMPLPPEAAWEVLRAGAADIFSLGAPATVAAAIAARFQRWSAVDAVLESPVVRRHLVGDSIPWRLFLRRIIDVAKFSTSAVLIRGESGTGKELVARLFHTLDGRADKRELVVLDCTTVVPELSGSEFFGHERGAYTGAVGARDGVFALADGGTLFLDEVGELPPRLQAELLRVVQEGTYKRVGGNTWQRTRFRLLCATHR